MSDKNQSNSEQKDIKREILEIIFLVLLAVGIALVIVNFVGQRTVVNGTSMVPTLHDKDQLIVYKLGYAFNNFLQRPEKGDVVVVWIPPEKRNKQSEKLYIKRVVATEGDTVEVKDKTVYLNNVPQNEPNVVKEGGLYVECDKQTVPVGYAFVMGDNRVNSTDSRELGFIPIKDIKGKAVFRFLPISDFGVVK